MDDTRHFNHLSCFSGYEESFEELALRGYSPQKSEIAPCPELQGQGGGDLPLWGPESKPQVYCREQEVTHQVGNWRLRDSLSQPPPATPARKSRSSR